MFGFMHRSTSRKPSAAIRRALEQDGLPAWIGSASMLRVVHSPGRFSDRKVTYIRVFDPVRAAERSLDVRGFRDLDAQPGLILKAGHIERDGVVVITRHGPPREVETRTVVPVDPAAPSGVAPAVVGRAVSRVLGGRS